MTTKSRIHAAPNARVRRPILAFVALIVLTTSVMWLPAGASAKPDHQTIVADSAPSVVPPNSPVGRQLSWLLGIGSLLPLSKKEEASHFDAPFIAAEPVAQLNSAFASLGSTGSRVTLLGLGDVTATTLKAAIKIGAITYSFRGSPAQGGVAAVDMPAAMQKIGLSEVELMSGDAEAIAGIPAAPGRGGGGFGGGRGCGRRFRWSCRSGSCGSGGPIGGGFCFCWNRGRNRG